ncbi:MAG: ABC transporter ATP-binding protein [Nostoc sp.]|uniref:ABC transporter ATP-binding protein n=1 Tax=Nostoc sp. TaxID=1180 RepID=UPI002FF45FAA
MKIRSLRLGRRQHRKKLQWNFPVNSHWQSMERLVQMGMNVPRQRLYLGMIAMILAALLDGLGIGLTIPFLRLLLNEGNGFHLPAGILPGVDLWVSQQSKTTLIELLVLTMLVSLALKSYFSYMAEVLTSVYREKLIALFRMRLYEKYINAPIAFFDNQKLGTLSSTLGEVISINIMLSFLISLITAGFILMAYLGTMVLVSWQLTLLIVLLIGSVGLGLNQLLRRIRKFGKAVVNARHDLNIRILDTLAGIRVVKSYAAERYELDRFERISNEVTDTSILVAKKVGLVEPLTEFSTMAVAMVILIVSYVLLISRGLLSTSELMAFMLTLIKVVPVTKRINTARGAIHQYLPSVSIVCDALFSTQSEQPQSGLRNFSHLREGVHFRKVSFGYNDGTTILKDIDLDIPCGQTIALVGSSGAGKSTVAALLPRFYDVTRGTIYIDGEDIRNYDVASLRRQFGIVSQDTYIFNASIRDNIGYGLETVSDDAILKAASLANADEFIQQLPRGYDTLIGDRGVQLSGGQRQRLSIARAILRDPEILILDEATSALDSQSERLVQEAIERLRQNRTVIVIAHRLSTIRNADWIIVMKNGEIVEAGTHDQLLNNRGIYWSFHNVQSIPMSS